MLAKRIVPCLDVKAGRVVKGVNFIELRDAGDPVEMAQIYNCAGADELVFLDITATHEDRDVIFDVIYRTAEQVFIPLTVGGGVNNTDIIKKLLRAGADKVSINSAAVKDPDFINQAARQFGLWQRKSPFHIRNPKQTSSSRLAQGPFPTLTLLLDPRHRPLSIQHPQCVPCG